MLTREDLLLQGVELPKEEKKIEMALPPSLDGKAGNSKKHKRLFSPALFKESLHSNRLSLTIVSICNALIMVVIITILSTLNINSTADAMKDLFSNADTETTIKSGAISLYSTFSNSADAYLTFEDSKNTLVSTTETAMNMVTDSSTKNQISSAKLVYDASYRLASGTEEEKNAFAKSVTMKTVETIITSDASKTDMEKEVALKAMSYYFDIYANDKTTSTETILKQAIPLTMTDVVSEQQSLDADKKAEVKTTFDTAFKRVFDNNEDKSKVSFETSLNMMKIMASGIQTEFVNNAVDKLMAKYNEDQDKYLADKTIEKGILSTEIQDYVFSTVKEFAYYQYLPDFTVEYVTSDKGYPVRYVPTGKYADNGNEIMEEIEIKSYNPSLYTEIKGEMGAKANMLEKMHKDVITGEGYTDEEIAQAKIDADKDLGMVKDQLASFMTAFLTVDKDNKNDYFDGTKLIEAPLVARVSNIVTSMAEEELIERYNNSHDVKISTIQEITRQNSSMSGEEMINTVKGYVDAGIASYNSYMISCSEKGYSDTDCLMVAMVKGSTGVIGQLPGKVTDSLTEMGQMNTYGIMVGVVGFGIAALLIPMVYTIMTANSLVADKVETGSLAFTLSTPIRRISYVFTEACYLVFTEVVMFFVLLVVSILTQLIGVACGGTDLLTSLPITDICFYALGNFMVTLAISGICFFASCFFNKSSQAIACGGGITIAFFIFSILGLFGTPAIPGTVRIDAMNYFNYFTIDSLFDAMAVMNNDWLTYGLKLVGLAAVFVVTYAVGMTRFTKKDLPL